MNTGASINTNAFGSWTMESSSVPSANATTTTQVVKETSSHQKEVETEGLIGDLALILIFGAIITVIFKKLKQPLGF